ncbi:MAG: hypothetical protein AB7O54_24455, partial [Pseudomonadales bacterium]
SLTDQPDRLELELPCETPTCHNRSSKFIISPNLGVRETWGTSTRQKGGCVTRYVVTPPAGELT